MKSVILTFISFLVVFSVSAQIGYQVSLLNNATGEPRANERVTVTVKITDSEGKTVCDETKNETSNDFGVISMSVGDSDTFANADWSKLPFFIEASVDGRLLGKSQLLSVPVAEYAKHTGILTKELLRSKEWTYDGYKTVTYKFKENDVYEVLSTYKDDRDSISYSGKYCINGNTVLISEDSSNEHGATVLFYSPNWSSFIEIYDGYTYK
ncbi:MAG: hypothetical protein HDS38_05895 [Bacteroides sp.]|nr:hypothetical protein [Bacteroides sp.]